MLIVSEYIHLLYIHWLGDVISSNVFISKHVILLVDIVVWLFCFVRVWPHMLELNICIYKATVLFSV